MDEEEEETEEIKCTS